MRIGWLGFWATAVVVTGAGEATANEGLARQAGCLDCHAPDRTVKGPAFHEVAARYKGVPRAREALVQKVKHGGKGNWTKVTGDKRMPPHSSLLSAREIQTLVDWVLGQ